MHCTALGEAQKAQLSWHTVTDTVDASSQVLSLLQAGVAAQEVSVPRPSVLPRRAATQTAGVCLAVCRQAGRKGCCFLLPCPCQYVRDMWNNLAREAAGLPFNGSSSWDDFLAEGSV